MLSRYTAAFTVHLLSYFFVRGWRFDILGLDEDKISLSRITVYGRRAFIAIPRAYDEQPVTLVEVSWPERSLYTIYNTKPFPAKVTQKIGECKQLQSVVTVNADNKGRLYVLDKGTKDVCSPKIVIYDLKLNKELFQKELTNVPPDNLSAMVIDLNSYNRDLRLIIADAGNNSLLVYNFNKQIWWRMSIRSPESAANEEEPPRQFSFDQLALSTANATLYATSSKSRELYSINMNEFRNLEDPHPLNWNGYEYTGTEISVTHIGDKFGNSTSLFVDLRGNVYYIYDRDYVILKLNPSKPFVDENVEVALQSYSLIPYPVQIFAEPYYKLWILNSKRNQDRSYVVQLKP